MERSGLMSLFPTQKLCPIDNHLKMKNSFSPRVSHKRNKPLLKVTCLPRGDQQRVDSISSMEDFSSQSVARLLFCFLFVWGFTSHLYIYHGFWFWVLMGFLWLLCVPCAFLWLFGSSFGFVASSYSNLFAF